MATQTVRAPGDGVDLPLLVSVNEAARLLGLSRAGVWRLRERDELPVVRIGGRVLVRRTDLDELIDRNRCDFRREGQEEDG